MTSEVSPFLLPFLKKQQRTKETFSFYFDTSKHGLQFNAGQYIRMFLETKQLDSGGKSRDFTISSSPEQKDSLMITTKITVNPSSFKQKLMSLRQGELVQFSGPKGAFVLPQQSQRPLVFLAGGIGINPFHSMILHAININYSMPITLLSSFSTVEEMIYYDELTELVNNYPLLKIVYTITHPEKSQKKWVGEKGKLSEELLKKHIMDVAAPDYFLCGPPDMVVALLELLEIMKVSPDHVNEEQFSGY